MNEDEAETSLYVFMHIRMFLFLNVNCEKQIRSKRANNLQL